MSGRKKEIKHGKAKSQHIRIEPIWNKSIDEKKLARTLARLAISSGGMVKTTSTDITSSDSKESS